MLIPCPLCGPRDLREFTPKGAASYAVRPGGEVWSDDWHNYLHLRDNPAGPSNELWWHGSGCGAWLLVERDTTTHAIGGVTLAMERAP